MIQCQKCGKSMHEEQGLVNTNIENNEKMILCEACFKACVGVDYKTFQMRKANAKQGCFATLVCLMVSVYAWMEYGILYGIVGIIITGLIHYFSAKIN